MLFPKAYTVYFLERKKMYIFFFILGQCSMFTIIDSK